MKKYYEYFYGNKVSDYGIEHGFVDYATLAESFDAVLNNRIIQKTWNIGYWEQVNGRIDNSNRIDELRDRIDVLESIQAEQDKPEQFYDIQDKIDELEGKIEELQDEQDDTPEIFQYFIISYNGADILTRKTNEIVFYNNELDLYVWGVTHWGTNWSNVLTDIALEEVAE